MSKITILTLGLLLGALSMASLPGIAQDGRPNQGGTRTAPGIQKPKSDKLLTLKFEWLETYGSEKTTRTVVLKTMDGIMVKSMDMGTIQQAMSYGEGQTFPIQNVVPRRSVTVTPEIGTDGRVLLDVDAKWPSYAVPGQPASYADREFSTIRSVAIGETVPLRSVDVKINSGNSQVNVNEFLSVTVTVE